MDWGRMSTPQRAPVPTPWYSLFLPSWLTHSNPLHKEITKLDPEKASLVENKRKKWLFFLMVSIGHLGIFYECINLRNRSSALEILLWAPKNIFKLVLRFEIHQFDVDQLMVSNCWWVSHWNLYHWNNGKCVDFHGKLNLISLRLTYLEAQGEFENVFRC